MSESTVPEAPTNAAVKRGHTELKVAAAALAAAASTPLGIAVAAGAALSSPDVRSVLRRATVKALVGAMQAGEEINAAVARRAAPAPSSEEADGPAVPTPTPSPGSGEAADRAEVSAAMPYPIA